MADEIVAVEALDLRPPRSTRERRNMGYVGLRDHRRHRLCDVFVDKLRLDMGVEHGAEVLIRFLIGGQVVSLPAQRLLSQAPPQSLSTETSGALAKRPPVARRSRRRDAA